MRDILKYQGIIPAFYACYDAKGNINPQAVENMTRHLLKKGVKGVYVGGSSGECIYQNVKGKRNCSRTCDESGRRQAYSYCSCSL